MPSPALRHGASESSLIVQRLNAMDQRLDNMDERLDRYIGVCNCGSEDGQQTLEIQRFNCIHPTPLAWKLLVLRGGAIGKISVLCWLQLMYSYVG